MALPKMYDSCLISDLTQHDDLVSNSWVCSTSPANAYSQSVSQPLFIAARILVCINSVRLSFLYLFSAPVLPSASLAARILVIVCINSVRLSLLYLFSAPVLPSASL